MLKTNNIFYLFISSLFFGKLLFISSLSYFILLSSSACSLYTVTPSSLFLFLLLSSPAFSPHGFGFFFFFFFFFLLSVHFLCAYFPLRRRGRRGSEAQLSDLKQSSPIFARQSKALLADLKLCSPSGNRRSLLVVLHSSRRRWLLRFLDLKFVGGSGDCGCSLWRWL